MAGIAVNQRWPAPAKLNLFLQITGRRDDGYHLLQTAFQFLSIADELEFRLRDDGVIHRVNEIKGISEDDDLCVRAARLLQSHTGTRQGADIILHKRLPAGGGVGGGSSDAATTLVALNHLWHTGLDPDALADLGLQLGADVPVFVRGHAAFAEGVGEKLTPMDFPEPWYLVVKPPVHVATEEIFSAPELTRNSPAIKICDLQTGALLPDQLTNVCEPVASQRYPEIAEALHCLQQYGNARMTGTGACVFVAFDDEAAARQAQQDFPYPWESFVAVGCNQSLLLQRLELKINN